MSALTVPDFLMIPPKLIPIINEFNNYRYFLLEGGRGGGKTQAVARLLLYLAENKELRIVCGREVQNTIEESVYTVFRDLIHKYELNFNVLSTRIDHKRLQTTIKFKGFREQGLVNIKEKL
jgi:phage terminase large subunit